MAGEPSLESTDDMPFKLTWDPCLVVRGFWRFALFAATMESVFVDRKPVAAHCAEKLSAVQIL